MSNTTRSWMGRLTPLGLLAAAAFATIPLADASAQVGRGDARGDIILDALGVPGQADFNVSQARRESGFRLFAQADAAGAGFRLAGNLDFATDNFSPCDAPLSGFCAWNLHPSRNLAATTFQFFEVLWAAGAPPSEWAKARRNIPSLGNALGGGYTSLMNYALFSGRAEWGPRDNTLATLFSGVASTSDGSCRDHTGFGNGFYPTGLPLLAGSDCPDTWPGGGWMGDRTTPLEGWKDLFDAQGDAFRWDYWQVPDANKRNSQFMGTAYTTYGESSDHYSEILSGYGSVIPGGTGDPAFQGWPLGLVYRFDAFTFGVPSLAGVVFYRTTIINRSEDVYGVGIDYDSLYVGLWPGTGGATAGGMQRYSNYYLPDQSLAVYHQSRVNIPGPCDEGSRTINNGCTTSTVGNGYGNGGNAIIVLKSPIGDLRNKLFTRTSSGAPCAVGVDPFCNPTHPLRGDTITFNHGHICGFGGCWASTHNVNDKRGFGMLSSTADNVMDGRAPSSLSGGEAWLTFRNFGYPTVIGQFNKYVPGVQGPPAATWDYNKDGVPDTLYYDTCHTNGCVVLDADTLPNGHIIAYGNVGGVLGMGPFPLAAGDTTSMYFAFVGDADSARTWASIDAAVDLYMNFFLAPEPPPVATIASTAVTAATDAGGNVLPEIRFFFTEDPEKWVDPFLTKLADDLAAAPPGTPLGDLVAANPTLVQDVRDRASDNLEAIEIYKSCDGGASFTGNSNCNGDPTADESGQAVGLGWETYSILSVDANNGDIPNTFRDGNVIAGKTYLYVLVSKSRGATFLVNDPTTGAPASVEFAPQIRNPLTRSTSEPNVASIYVPGSRASGFQPAQFSYSQTGVATVPFSVDVSDNPTAGNYTIAFGNAIIVERDSNTTTQEVDGTRVIVRREIETEPAGAIGIIRADTVFRAGADVLPVAGTPDASGSTTVGNIRRVFDEYYGTGFVVTAGSTPLFASNTLTGSAATPTSVFALPDYPGFTVTANNTTAGNFSASTETAYRGATTRSILGVDDTSDVVPRGDVDGNMVQFRQEDSEANPYGWWGRWVVTWASDAFGLAFNDQTIRVDPTNPAATETALNNALASRPAALTGLTDAATAALLDSEFGGGITQQDLVPVRVPFTARNATFGRDVSVAALRNEKNTTYRVGSGSDTVRVAIPETEWVPGDVLYFIENVARDSIGANGYVEVDGAGQPIRISSPAVTMIATLGCNGGGNPPFCNPTSFIDSASTGYLPTSAGDSLDFQYLIGFSDDDRWVFDLIPPVSGSQITQVTDSALAEIRVVPNPFIVYSQYQTSIADSRILWTNVPPRGTMRVYTVSGQFVQQITWEPADLNNTGDLYWDLRSREDIDIASGLYIWVLTAPSNPQDANSAPLTARGKFVIIRGQPR